MTREEHLEQALKQARALLLGYGDHHMAKSPPQRDKALRNYLMVDQINRALLSEPDLLPSPAKEGA